MKLENRNNRTGDPESFFKLPSYDDPYEDYDDGKANWNTFRVEPPKRRQQPPIKDTIFGKPGLSSIVDFVCDETDSFIREVFMAGVRFTSRTGIEEDDLEPQYIDGDQDFANSDYERHRVRDKLNQQTENLRAMNEAIDDVGRNLQVDHFRCNEVLVGLESKIAHKVLDRDSVDFITGVSDVVQLLAKAAKLDMEDTFVNMKTHVGSSRRMNLLELMTECEKIKQKVNKQ